MIDKRCIEIREELAGYAEGETSLSMRRHLAGCAGCRAELERYQQLAQSLSAVRGSAVEPPPDLFPALVAIPRNRTRIDALKSHVGRHRRSYAGGVALAFAGVAGAALWQRRRAALA